MASTPHEKLVSFSENYDLEESEYVEDYKVEKSTSSSCCCFRRICFRWRPNNNGTRGGDLLRQRQQGGEKEKNWMVNKMTRKVKQLSTCRSRRYWRGRSGRSLVGALACLEGRRKGGCDFSMIHIFTCLILMIEYIKKLMVIHIMIILPWRIVHTTTTTTTTGDG